MPRQVRRFHAALLSLALGLAACNQFTGGTPGNPAPTPTPNPAPSEQLAGPVSVWLTTGDQAKLLSAEPQMAFSRDGGETYPTITVDAGRTYQTMEGVGAALTDSSAYLMQQKLSAAQRDDLLRSLFDAKAGAGLDYVRLPMGASDFARSSYTYDDVPDGQTDPTLAQFSIAHDLAEIVPVAKGALAINPALKFMASPWSAPAWMKTIGSLIKGELKPEFHEAYANYFQKFIQAYKDQGIAISAVTVQNEPHYEPNDYPGMRMEPAQQAAFVGDFLGPTLRKAAPDTKILAWDHNWDEPNYPLDVLNDAKAASYLDGSAFHCYGGDVGAQSQVHDTYPTKNVYFTECSGSSSAPVFGDNLKWNARNLLIGAPRNWAKTVLLWNLALDPDGNPHTGGCNGCRGVVTIDQNTGAVTKNVEYYVLGHYGKAVRPGALRVDSATYNTDAANLQSVAFRNPDGSKALIVLNDSAAPLTFKVKESGASFYATLPGGALATYTWSGRGATTPPPVAPAIDAFGRVEAEGYSTMKGVSTEACSDEGGGRDVGYTDPGDYLVFDRLDFGAGGAGSVSFRVASGAAGGTIELHVGSADGPLLASATAPGTGDWQKWQTVTAPVADASLAGTQKIYVVFKDGGLNFNWFQFAR